MTEQPLLSVTGLTKYYGAAVGCEDVSFQLYEGEVLAVVGESGSGKSTLLRCLAADLAPSGGCSLYRTGNGQTHDVFEMDDTERQCLTRAEWGFVRQDPAEGLRMNVSAGGNIGEQLIVAGNRHFGRIRAAAQDWLDRVEIEARYIDETPKAFSGGMRQRLQIARNLVMRPKLVFMDEPTSALDVSVQARLLDLIRGLVQELGLAVVIVTHDLSVARLLSHRILVMRHGRILERGLTDRVLDDPAEPYTQLLVSSVPAV
ncbi:MAG: phosphonate C-P lyase system protein PhnK [Alphaproteobacteria bacterium]|nr:phosphonate C-P lyase system protein PhnK [Alphaproteobacteria bacterium]